jgi:hypothetical protein
MLMVKTIVKESTIPGAGLGLFADEFIKKGTVTWRFCPNFDQILHEEDLLRLSIPARYQFLKYCYKSKEDDHYVLCGDDERFINHSDNPNIVDELIPEKEPFSIAERDINPGEELFCNYFDFDANAEMKLNNNFGEYISTTLTPPSAS